MRLFFALWPPAAAALSLEAWAREAQRDTGGRIIPAGNIHLTLAFLGEADPQPACAAARGVHAWRHFLPLEEARYVKRNRMVWARPRAMPEALEHLGAALQAELRAAGFALEKRAFAAHVTLVRNARPPRLLAELPHVEWPVDEFTLVASRTAREGSRYERVAHFTLAQAK